MSLGGKNGRTSRRAFAPREVFPKTPKKTHENPSLPAGRKRERYWNKHVGWKSEGRVEHDTIVWLSCRYSESAGGSILSSVDSSTQSHQNETTHGFGFNQVSQNRPGGISLPIRSRVGSCNGILKPSAAEQQARLCAARTSLRGVLPASAGRHTTPLEGVSKVSAAAAFAKQCRRRRWGRALSNPLTSYEQRPGVSPSARCSSNALGNATLMVCGLPPGLAWQTNTLCMSSTHPPSYW